jgi:hypothetical protein
MLQGLWQAARLQGLETQPAHSTFSSCPLSLLCSALLVGLLILIHIYVIRPQRVRRAEEVARVIRESLDLAERGSTLRDHSLRAWQGAPPPLLFPL